MAITLRRETLAEQVAEHLRREIETRGLVPGDALPSEQQLARDYHVSRPVVREALKTLEARGIIEIVSGKSATIKAINSDPIRDFFHRAVQVNRQTIVEMLELRRGIEIQSAHLAAQRRTADEMAELSRLVQAMREHLRDQEQYSSLDLEFHLVIARASRNMMVFYMVESIRQPVHDVIREGMRRRNSDSEYERVQELHEDLCAAIASGDAQRAGLAMASHFDDALLHLSYADQAEQVAHAPANPETEV